MLKGVFGQYKEFKDGHICPDVVESFAIRQSIYHEELMQEKIEAGKLKHRARNPVLAEPTPREVSSLPPPSSSRSSRSIEPPVETQPPLSSRSARLSTKSSRPSTASSVLEEPLRTFSSRSSRSATDNLPVSSLDWRQYRVEKLRSLQHTHPELLAQYRQSRMTSYLASPSSTTMIRKRPPKRKPHRVVSRREDKQEELLKKAKVKARVKRERLQRVGHRMDQLQTELDRIDRLLTSP